MANRTYNQFCSAARALDVVGERWTLLIVRDLAIGGPRRFTDLRAGLPDIAPNVLSQRLQTLAGAGVIRQRTLPPPAASTVYELTEAGEALRPMLVELIRWGLRYMHEGPRDGERFDVAWLAAAVEALAGSDDRPPPERAETFEIRLPEGTLHARAGADGLRVTPGAAEDPDVVLTTDVETFLAVGLHDLDPATAVADGRMSVDGDADGITRAVAALRPPHPTPAA